MIQSEIGGIVIMAKQDIGAAYRSGDTVVTMIDPQLSGSWPESEKTRASKIFCRPESAIHCRCIRLEKNDGEVEAVIQSKRSGDVVFNISDKREEKGVRSENPF